MRILTHDYGGYAFPSQLSRSLAKLGHQVLHAYCSSLSNTPIAGASTESSEHIRFRGIDIGRPVAKYNYVSRWRDETEYARRLCELMSQYRPDVVISANAPLDVQKRIWATADRHGIAKVYWLQDLLGVATRAVLSTKSPLLGLSVGNYYLNLERRLLRNSTRVVAISDDFVTYLDKIDVQAPRGVVVPNWAPLEEIPMRARDNDWSREFGLSPDKVRFIYSGNLGAKHEPHELLRLAQHLNNNGVGEFVVVSQGQGADWLRSEQERLQVGSLKVLPFQPKERFPEVLGAADVLVVQLGIDAGKYSTPSKVLSYLCAGRPVLASMPTTNYMARLIRENQAGLVAEPNDSEEFVRHADTLISNASLRTRLGSNARAYAEVNFDLDTITTRFEAILLAAQNSAEEN